MTFETRQHRVTVGITVTPFTLSTTIKIHGNFLTVPRNSRAHLISIQGSIAEHADTGQADNKAIMGWVKATITDAVAEFPSTNQWANLTVLWSHVNSHVIAGTPANFALVKQGTRVDVNLAGKAFSSITMKGARSNEIQGWCFAGIADANIAMIVDLTIDYVVEWLEGSGSKKDRPWIDDETENTDDDE